MDCIALRHTHNLPCTRFPLVTSPCCSCSVSSNERITPCQAVPGKTRCPESLSRSEEHTSELQSPCNLVCRLLLEKKKSELFISSLSFAQVDGVKWLSRITDDATGACTPAPLFFAPICAVTQHLVSAATPVDDYGR